MPKNDNGLTLTAARFPAPTRQSYAAGNTTPARWLHSYLTLPQHGACMTITLLAAWRCATRRLSYAVGWPAGRLAGWLPAVSTSTAATLHCQRHHGVALLAARCCATRSQSYADRSQAYSIHTAALRCRQHSSSTAVARQPLRCRERSTSKAVLRCRQHDAARRDEGLTMTAGRWCATQPRFTLTAANRPADWLAGCLPVCRQHSTNTAATLRCRQHDIV